VATRKPNNHSEVVAILLGYKRHAKARGYEFNLTIDQVKDIIFLSCYYCGRSRQNIKKTRHSLMGGLSYNGIDRKDNDLDYTIENCVPCCGQCNKAKGNLKFDFFIDWINALVAKWGS
jgi:hypothetical protein